MAGLIGGAKDAGLPRFLDAERRFSTLLAERPNDPAALSMQSYTRLTGFQAASQLGREDVSARLIRDAKASVDQLVAIEPNDDAIAALSGNITEGLAQNLRDQDRFAETVAMQRTVISRRRRVADTGSPSARGDLGFSLGILGIIARDAKDRRLACASWQEAEAIFSGLAKLGQLIGIDASFLPGLRANVAVCRANGPSSGFGPLRR